MLAMLLSFVGMAFEISAQTEIRPYQEWNETAFVSLKGHQPANYVRPDNNWDILYTLRTPYTQAELNAMGIPCTKSQLMLLEIGGLIQKEGKKWHSAVPIFDKKQTDGLRAYSKQVADKIYALTKLDFQSLMEEIGCMGFKDNTASLIFRICWMDGCGRNWFSLMKLITMLLGVVVIGCFTIIAKGLRWGPMCMVTRW